MQELITILTDFFKSLPVWGKFVLLPFMFFAYWLAKRVFKNKKLQINIIILIKKFIKNSSRKDLQSHDIFINLELYIRRIKNMDFGTNPKNFIFKSILINKIKVISKSLKVYVEAKTFYNLAANCLALSLIKLTDKNIEDYEALIYKEIKNKYFEKDYDGIFYTVMHSENGFNKYHFKNIDSLYIHIEKIANSTYLDDNHERIEMYMDMTDVAIQSTVLDAEIAFKNFNGNFDKYFE